MKTLNAALLAVALVVLSVPAFAQEHGSGHHGKTAWKEMDAFHTLMAATWHPVKSNDLKLIRAKADSLAAAAKIWSGSKVPAACDTKPIRDAIADVVAGSTKVLHLVHGNAADTELKSALREVHERFEVVEKGCKPDGGVK